ncbi:MAG: efflux RND transporter periplasmic adaptor subunit [Phycisphaerae bacterium]|nr:efflux RND transporter periplasmic adaptor subunit [Phycisphaerae bacterium]
MLKGVLGSVTVLALLAVGSVRSGCRSEPPPAAVQQAPEVAVVVVAPEPVSLTTDLPGRTSAYLEAEVRPQVSGILQSRRFEEGQDVKAGDVLYEIDPSRYQAVYDQAKAALAVAKAQVPALQARAERSTRALANRAVSEQDVDEAVAALKQGEATVELRAAEVESARIELSYTRITAPISGRIGKSNVTVGALVTAHQPLALATIQQLDPIYVDVPQSTAKLLRLQRTLNGGSVVGDAAAQSPVKLFLEDGTPYSRTGTLQFRDVTVDPTTGSVTLRMVFPNPEYTLLPGMFVRAVLEEGVLDRAILVPQQAVSRNPRGEPYVMVVDADNKVQQRTIVADRAMADKWLAASGLNPGDRVIVEGLQRVRPGASVRVTPAKTGPDPSPTPATSAPSAAN